ncbi:MAG: VWA domain-containing protein [Bryobacteraceae bacterium]
MSVRSFDRRRGRRGIVVIMLSLMVSVVMLPLVGLAIDGSILYLAQAKLSAAVDAAALAGARSLSVGLDLASQTASATATAQSFFNANFPSGYWNTSNQSVSISIAETAYKTRTVTMQASVSVPLTFMRLLGQTTSVVSAQGQASRRDVIMIVVIDRSSSMQNAGVCGTMIAAAQNFVGYFANGRDTIGLVTFMDGYNLTYAPTLNFASNTPSLSTVLGGLKCYGDTGTAGALNQAYAQLKIVNEPGALNLIVFFTDGHPNGIAANFPVKTKTDTRYDYQNYSTLVSTPASSCSSITTLPGEIAEWSGEPAPAHGSTEGLFAVTSSSGSTTSEQVAAGLSGCGMASNQAKMRRDIAYIPSADLYSNSTTGYQSFASGDLYPSGNPYAGQIRVDTPTAVVTASVNAADNQATTIRNDPNLIPVIYSIGLGGTSAEPIDATFMERVANDPRSPIYNSAKPAGLYVYSPTATDLAGAFQQIASEILRLSQ